MTITAWLADALRALFDSPREGQMGDGTKLLCGELKLDEARLALAAYDAQLTSGEGGELDAHDFAYRHLSVPGCDGERAWTQWQQFGKDMQIRRITATPQP